MPRGAGSARYLSRRCGHRCQSSPGAALDATRGADSRTSQGRRLSPSRNDLGIRRGDRAQRLRAMVLRRGARPRAHAAADRRHRLFHAALHRLGRRVRVAGRAYRRHPRSRVTRHILALFALLLLAPSGHAALPAPVARASVAAGGQLNAVGIAVRAVKASRPLVVDQTGHAIKPASLVNLATTYTALELLGPDYRWKAHAYRAGPLEGGVLHGELIVKGAGD